MRWERLGAVVAAFALALGVGAHALDELRGRPLGTAIPDRVLVALAVGSIAGACAIGLAGAAAWGWWLALLVAAGAFLVLAYNLELLGGPLPHRSLVRPRLGRLPGALRATRSSPASLSVEAALAAAFAVVLSLAQRVLSTNVRFVRRRVAAVRGELELADGGHEPIDEARLIAADERALLLLAAATVLLAAALVVLRL